MTCCDRASPARGRRHRLRFYAVCEFLTSAATLDDGEIKPSKEVYLQPLQNHSREYLAGTYHTPYIHTICR